MFLCMTIKEVGEKFNISQDTLRYYERIGLIPPVSRTASGIRNYQKSDLDWVEHAVCMRSAGVPIEALIEYVKLFQIGDSTFEARRQLLKEQYDILMEQKQQIEATVERLKYKVSRYEEAVKTGVLTWEEKECKLKMYIEKINGPDDVKKIEVSELPKLAEEMRHALLIRASKHGGHFGPNFGMVEATIALHYVFDSPKDKIVFDVSHQSYPHKMLTGRKDAYLYEEHYDDVSGYTNPHESAHDFFTVGHTSTSVSLACGLAKARDLNGEHGNVIAVTEMVL